MSEADKTRDKNVRNIEKDIERCEQLTKPEHANWIGISNQLAISHILAELEQMLKEREKYTIHLTDEEYRKVIANAQKNVANDSVIAHKFAVMQQQIDEKDKRIQELDEQVKMLDEAYIGTIKESKKWFDISHNSIPKQAVIDKIKELKLSGGSDGKDNVENLARELTIDILQELLERRK